MAYLIKLTNADGTTRGKTPWVVGETVSVDEALRVDGAPLCSHAYLHAYASPDMAVFLAPRHGWIRWARAFVVQGDIIAEEWDKVGCHELRVVAEVDLRRPGRCQVVAFARACADAVARLWDSADWSRLMDAGQFSSAVDASAASYASAAASYASDAAAAASYASDAADIAALARQAMTGSDAAPDDDR